MFDTETKSEITKIARRLDVPAAALMAVAEVESAGKTLARVKDRDEPLIRFEGHYFYRFLKGTAREKAVKAGLAHKSAGRVKNSRSQIGRWALLENAIKINRIAALSSCSWGLGQVMGSHWQWLGYGSVDALVAEARSGVAGQVELMARYIEKAKLVKVLQRQDWAKFARAYNGPGYAKNRYDVKMARAFERYSKLPDPEPELPAVQADDAADVLMFGARGKAIKSLQRQLTARGYPLVCDGLFGLVTDRVLRQFQRDHRLEENGIFGRSERRILLGLKEDIGGALATKKKAAQERVADIQEKIGKQVAKSPRTLFEHLLSIFKRFA